MFCRQWAQEVWDALFVSIDISSLAGLGEQRKQSCEHCVMNQSS